MSSKKSKPVRTEKTPYGIVDADALEKLEESFRTIMLFNIVDLVDEIRGNRMPTKNDIRFAVLNLHRMALCVIDNDYPDLGPGGNIYEVAEQVAKRLDEYAIKKPRRALELERAARFVRKLTALRPGGSH